MNTYIRYDKQLGLITRHLFNISILKAIKTEQAVSALLCDGLIRLVMDFSCAYKRYGRNSRHGFGVVMGFTSKLIDGLKYFLRNQILQVHHKILNQLL